VLGRAFSRRPFGIASGQILGDRANQQDVVQVLEKIRPASGPTCAVIILADGMGGHAAGEEASAMACAAVAETLAGKFKLPDSREMLIKAALAANRRIAEEAAQSPEKSGMGTTLIAVLAEPLKRGALLRWVSVGDSPFWIWRRKTRELIRVNAIHSLYGEMVQEVQDGLLTREEAERDPRNTQRNVLTLSLAGGDLSPERMDCPDSALQIDQKDIVIIASDGIETLSAEDISGTVRQFRKKGPEAISEALLERLRSLDMPGQDNSSVIVMTCA